MKQLKLRFAQPEDANQLVEWLNANPYNEYNPDILKSKSLRVLCSYDESGPQAYLPVNKVLVLESYAPRPGLSNAVSAQALRDFTKASLLIASGEGINEVYFLDGSNGVAKMAINNHYDLLVDKNTNEPYKIYRIKV